MACHRLLGSVVFSCKVVDPRPAALMATLAYCLKYVSSSNVTSLLQGGFVSTFFSWFFFQSDESVLSNLVSSCQSEQLSCLNAQLYITRRSYLNERLCRGDAYKRSVLESHCLSKIAWWPFKRECRNISIAFNLRFLELSLLREV